MIRKAFKMKLYPGFEQEYEKRHNALWPEMKDMIHEYGGRNYSIYLDKETLTLFGYIEIEDEAKWNASAETAICRKWWDYMADIMATNSDNSPVSIDLKQVFHLDEKASCPCMSEKSSASMIRSGAFFSRLQALELYEVRKRIPQIARR